MLETAPLLWFSGRAENVLASAFIASMDFSLTDQQILLRDTVRRFMEAEVRPILREYDREEKFPAEEIRRLGELGCCGMLIPEEWGGAGMDTISYVLMLEEVARVDASMAVALSVTNSVVAVPLWKHGTDAQRRKYLPPLGARRNSRSVLPHRAAGRVGFGELQLKRRAARRRRIWLTGTKSWVTSGRQSGLYSFLRKTDPQSRRARRHGVSRGTGLPRLSRQPLRG